MLEYIPSKTEEENSMKCPYCNQEIPDGSAECPVCKKNLMETPVEAGQSSQADGSQAGEPAALAVAEKKSGKAWIAGAAVAAVAVIGGVAFWQMNKQDPKDVVIEAFKGVMAEGQTDPMEEIFGWKALGKKLYSDSYQVNMNLTLGELLGSAEMQGTGFTINAREDRESRTMDMDMGFQYGDIPMFNAKVYLDDSEMAVALPPDMTNKVFTLNLAEDLDTQIANSPYLGKNLADMGMDLQGYADYMKRANELSHSETPMFDIEALWDRYKTGSKAVDNLKAAMTVEKGESKSCTVGDAEVECDGYDVVLSNAALVQFFTETKDFFLADETLKKDMITYLELVYDLNASLYSSEEMAQLYGLDSADMTPEQQQTELWTSADEAVETLLSQLEGAMGDVTLAVYVTDDGKLASFDYSTELSMAGQIAEAETAAAEESAAAAETADTMKLHGTVNFRGGYSQTANIEASLTAEDPSGETFTVDVAKIGEYEKDKSYQAQLAVQVEAAGEKMLFSLGGEYDIPTANYTIDAYAEENETEIGSILISGIVEDLVPGESFNAVVDSLSVIAGPLDEGITLAELSGSYGIKPLEEAVSKPEGEAFDILAATEEEWNAVIMELYMGLSSILSSTGLS